MPQLMLPIFPEGVAHLAPELAVKKEDGQVTYFNGVLPVFTHAENDLRTFRMITSQFYCTGVVKQADICRVFGVTPMSVKRSVKRYRESGPAGFYAKRKTRGAGVLIPDVLQQAQELLDDGRGVPEVAERLGLKRDTLGKAVRDGRLRWEKKTAPT